MKKAISFLVVIAMLSVGSITSDGQPASTDPLDNKSTEEIRDVVNRWREAMGKLTAPFRQMLSENCGQIIGTAGKSSYNALTENYPNMCRAGFEAAAVMDSAVQTAGDGDKDEGGGIGEKIKRGLYVLGVVWLIANAPDELLERSIKDDLIAIHPEWTDEEIYNEANRMTEEIFDEGNAPENTCCGLDKVSDFIEWLEHQMELEERLKNRPKGNRGGAGVGPKSFPNLGGEDTMFIGVPGPPGAGGAIGGKDQWIPGGNINFPDGSGSHDSGTVLGDQLTNPNPGTRGDNKPGPRREK